MRATRALIHLDNFHHNIQQIKQHLHSSVQLCLPVKADAYGHGALRIAREAEYAGVSYLAVASVEEAIELRTADIALPIIVLGVPLPEDIADIITYRIEPLVFTQAFITQLNKKAAEQNKIISVHLKIDTGMNRIGCSPLEAAALARAIADSPYLALQGVATHFAVSDSSQQADGDFTRQQLNDFNYAIQQIKKQGISIPLIHAANSGAVQHYPEAYFSMVRTGLLAYGYNADSNNETALAVKPVMELVTQVVFIKKIAAGTTVSYGRKWTAEEDTVIATLPIGYADGLRRSLSEHLRVRIGKSLFPLAGTICMDQCMIDLGLESTVQESDDVCIFGVAEKDNTAATLADLAQTVPYEITCGISKRVPRVYTNSPLSPL